MNDPVHAAVIERPGYARDVANESGVSAVSWGAVVGGAFVTAAMSLILLALGSGLGFLSLSPWQDVGTAAKTLGIVGAIYLALTQLVAGALGGYVAGRLRTRWVDVHTDEVYFRDTAHGFLVWAVGLVATAAFVTSAGTALIGGAAKVGGAALVAGAAGAGAAASQPASANATATGIGANAYASYLADRLLRRDASPDAARAAANGAEANAVINAPSAGATAETSSARATTQTGVAPGDAATRAEMARLFAVGLLNGELSPADRAYAASVVVRSTGMSQADAERRVDEVLVQAKTRADEARAAADTGRKAAAYFSLWAFASLLLGAFSSSYAATRGGRRRDGLVD